MMKPTLVLLSIVTVAIVSNEAPRAQTIKGSEARGRLAVASTEAVRKPEIIGQFELLSSEDASTGLVVNGVAKGLDPAQTYVSLIYNDGSLASGPNACAPTNGLLDGTQMFVGFWNVGPDGSGKLFALKLGESYASLADIGTVSIREVQGPAPSGFVLQSCGSVRDGNRTLEETKGGKTRFGS